MILFHNIGNHKHSNYNTREQVASAQGPISFDGIYLNVYENRDVLKDKEVILFVMGDYIGGNNDFDLQAHPNSGLCPENYCTMNQLLELRDDYGCLLGWHTWSHRNLTKLSDDEIKKELTRPDWCLPLLAYPFGEFNKRVESIASEMGYFSAWTVEQGNNTNLQKKRRYF